LGEHHRPDYVVSSPEMVLSAAASITKNIKLMSAVTVLSSAEPVKVYQDFSTLDLISGGRAEIGVGRGSFIESFPLFGYNLNDYHELFEEKLDLLLKINSQENVTWKGNLELQWKIKRFIQELRTMVNYLFGLQLAELQNLFLELLD
jgi:alkanesulfonate monooxygenase SsuD/methylene tetrahydromethanopterin reductase-like flavin-dependent oxidoreductase (luciferase family)